MYRIQVVVRDESSYECESGFNLVLRNSRPQLNPPLIQAQFNDKLKHLGVLQKFEFQASQKSFTDIDNDALTYQMFMVDSAGDKIAAPPWFTVDHELISMSGTPPLQVLGRTITLKVVASDGLFSAEQTVAMKVVISWGFWLYLLPKIIGPIATLFALFNYRGLIHEMACKKWYQNRKDHVTECGSQMYFTIPLIAEEYEKQRNIYRSFKLQIPKIRCAKSYSKKKWIYLYYSRGDNSFDGTQLESDFNNFCQSLLQPSQVKGLQGSIPLNETAADQ